jgi:prepilin-type processing-associated H-X9-DG protein
MKNNTVGWCPSDPTAPRSNTTGHSDCTALKVSNSLSGPTPSYAISGNLSRYSTQAPMTLAGIRAPASIVLIGPVRANFGQGPRKMGAGDYNYGEVNRQAGVYDAVRRHQEGANWVFSDGHAKWYRPEQLCFSDSGKCNGIKAAWFDPATE